MTHILFFGSSDYCLPILESLIKNTHLLGIITRPDKPVGRKQILTPTKVKQYAIQNNIPVFTPKDQAELTALKETIQKLHVDVALVADYGLIIPKDIFVIPKYNTLNIHFSRLPLLRGASPVQYTILLGEKSAWISVILMDEKMDTGDIVWQKEYPLNQTETTQELYTKLFIGIANELPKMIHDYSQGKITPQKQDNTKATYTRKLTRADGFIPWEIIRAAMEEKQLSSPVILNLFTLSLSNVFQDLKSVKPVILKPLLSSQNALAIIISRALLAFSPWPGVWTEIEIEGTKKRMKILKVHVEKSKQLVLDLVQIEGKNPISWQQFFSKVSGNLKIILNS
jgi:methionyl-tRNA formyltransferase